MNKIIQEIIDERKKQDEKWGEQNHTPYKWLVILMEELGKASKEILEYDCEKYRKEMIRVAAVSVAALECFDKFYCYKNDKTLRPEFPCNTLENDRERII